MIPAQADIEKLVRQYPTPDMQDLNAHMNAIERMAGFYKMKLPDAPKGQQPMFNEFVSALAYSHEIVRAYYGLTLKLEKYHENRIDS